MARKKKYSKIIISHPGTDFDSLASMWAAHLLDPDTPVVLIARTDSNVREFLALYGNEFPMSKLREIDISAVKHLTVVDCSSRTQLGRIEGLLDRENVHVEVWDHHRKKGPEFKIDRMHYKQVGANVTLLIQELAERGISPSLAEATLLLLGIYEDTGGLRFPSTTTHDLDAASWLLKHGASLKIVDRFMGIKLNRKQKELLTDLNLNVQVIDIRGIPIAITLGNASDFVDEIAFLTRKVQEAENADVIFSLVKINDRVFIVGRSRLPAVNVGRILSSLGGGGHPQAASCLLTVSTHPVALQRLVDAIREDVKPSITARDIMSTQVRTIDESIHIDEAHTIITHSGYSGLPVVDSENRVIGVITRSDIDKALQHGLGHAPVKGYMAREPVTINEESSIDEIQNIIIEKRAGFLPVVFGEKLSGVVTRTDVLGALHNLKAPFVSGGVNGEKSNREFGRDLIAKLPDQYTDILAKAGELADKIGVSCYLVGGIIRDLVLQVETIDIDLLIEGDGINFAHEFAASFDAKVIENPRFRTAKVVIDDTLTIDIATAREEFYPQPGALPEVAAAGIRDDLVRRDFTINTLAIQLNTRNWGLLIDHFGGLRDIENGTIKVLHTFSFVEDPTRVLRALRFAGRFGMKMENQTRELLMRALKEGRLDHVSPERIRDEILLCLREKNPWPLLKRLADEGILGILYQSLYLPVIMNLDEDPIRPAYDWIINYLDKDELPELEYCYAAILLTDSDTELALGFVMKYKLNQNFIALAKNIPGFRKTRDLLNDFNTTPSEIALMLEGIPKEYWVVLAALTGDDGPGREHLVKYLAENKNIHPLIDGNDLKKAGYKPGPKFRKALEEVRAALINGLDLTKDEEMEIARKTLGG